MISLTLLGPVRVTVGGKDPPAELLWRKNLALLLYLARSPRGRTREQLVGLLWPEKDDAKARHSLNEALRVLRQSLGDAVESGSDTLTITAGSCQADVDRLDALSTETLSRPFLEGFTVPDAPAFEDWLTAERLRLRGLQLSVLGQRAERALAGGQAGAARDAALAGLALDPHHEASARHAMRAHALEGARSLALDTFDRLTDRLDQDLGIAADPETARLAERIRQGRIVRGAPAEAAPQPMVPLVGKARTLLEEMSRVWAEARDGAARVLIIYGDPGTGKTRLLDELSARARLDGAVVAQSVAARDAGRPLLVVLDRSEPVEADAIRREPGPVCFAVASAPGVASVDTVAERVGRDVRGAVLRTTAFDAADIAELVRWAVPAYGEPAVERLVRRVLADTAGNPFLASELVLALKGGFNLPEPSRPWPAVHRTLDDTLPADLPESVGAALRVRYRSLSEGAQKAMAAVAVLGNDVPLDALARGTEMKQAELEAALDELEWARWLVSDARGYSVATRLAKEVVLHDMVTGGQQRRIRERAGSSLA